jgi:hypothetical protein
MTQELTSMEGHRMSQSLAGATLLDAKNIFYSLPRPGIHHSDDPYTTLFYSDFQRDLKLMNSMGVTTVVTYNEWKFGRSHHLFLETMHNYNMTLGLRFAPDTNGVLRRSIEQLKKLLVDANVTLEFLIFDYPLNFDNAASFFLWLRQVRTWMKSNDLKAPIFLSWFRNADASAIPGIAKQWDDQTGFDAWLVEAYSTTTMSTWANEYLTGQKGVFFLYGADSWNTTAAEEALDQQAAQLDVLMDWISNNRVSHSNGSYSGVVGGALQGYADSWYLGASETAYVGSGKDICPDRNPYIQSSCGVSDPNVVYGDNLVSVEHMGVMKDHETIWYTRCVEVTPASKLIQSRWNSTGVPIEDTCVFSLTLPGFYVIYLWAAGFAVVILGIVTSWLRSCCCRNPSG